MPCKNHREALIEAAASGASLSCELELHLRACPACANAFAQETRLFAAIDNGVHDIANAEVPPAILYRVKSAVEETEIVAPRWKHGLILAAASVAIVAATFASVHQRFRARGLQSSQAFVVPVHPQIAPPILSKAVESPMFAASAISRGASYRKRSVAISRPASDHLDVLVPPEERDAFARYLASVQGQSTGFAAVAVAAPPQSILPDGMKPLEIADLVVDPLDAAEEKTAESPREDH